MAENDPTSNPGTSQPNHYPFLGRKIQDGDLGSLDGYRVKRLLGQGGMGYVFLGEDIHLGREVALKVMRPEEKNKACARERFILEGRAVASITNDHVVIIHQVGEAQGIHYLAMELLHGMALDKWMEKQTSPVSFVVACKLIRDTLRGLAAAHEAGLVHRDIKPSNLWLEEKTGRVKVLDFGLTRATRSGENLTQEGMLVGTLPYMSPEQAIGKPVSPRSDLFSVGTVFYTLLSGSNPFQRESNVAILGGIINRQPARLSLVRPGIPPELAEFIERLLMKNPNKRPVHAGVALRELTEVERLVRISVATTPVSRPAVSSPNMQPRATAIPHGASTPLVHAPFEPVASNDQPLLENVQEPSVCEPVVSRRNLGLFGMGIGLATLPLLLYLGFSRQTSPPDSVNKKPPGQQMAETEPSDIDVERLVKSHQVWQSEVANLPSKPMAQRMAERIRELNPGFKPGEMKYESANGREIHSIHLKSDKLTNLEPLKVLKSLTHLSLSNCPVENINSLEGLALKEFHLDGSRVTSLLPLAMMPLEVLSLQGSPVSDLGPLRKCTKLTRINLSGTQVISLEPLSRLGVVDIQSEGTKIPVEELMRLPMQNLKTGPLRQYELRLLFDIKSLRTINEKSVDEWKAEIARLAKSKAPQVDSASAKIAPVVAFDTQFRTANPLFQGKITPGLRGDEIESLEINGALIVSLDPIQGLKMLRRLSIRCPKDQGGKKMSLEALRGLKIENLAISNLLVSDLAPLEGMPLTRLDISGTGIADITPLAAMRLEAINLQDCPVKKLDILRKMPLQALTAQLQADRDGVLVRRLTSLEIINGEPAGPFRDKFLDDREWLKKTEKLAPEQGIRAVCERLERVNPGFQQAGEMTYAPRVGPVHKVVIQSDLIEDLEPLLALPHLKEVECRSRDGKNGCLRVLPGLKGTGITSLRVSGQPVLSLEPLRGSQLRELEISNLPITDLGPLAGLPLEKLFFQGSPVASLEPVAKCRLKHLNCSLSKVASLEHLAGMPLISLQASGTACSDIKPLRGLPLELVHIDQTRVADLSPLGGMRLRSLRCEGSRVSDLAPLRGMPLTELGIGGTGVTDLAFIRGMQLTSLSAFGLHLKTLQPLQGMPLEKIELDEVPLVDWKFVTGLRRLRSLVITVVPPDLHKIVAQMKTLQFVNGAAIAPRVKAAMASNARPTAEILNSLLVEIQKSRLQGLPGLEVRIDAALVSRLRLTDGVQSAGAGQDVVDRRKNLILWPECMKSVEFQAARKQLDVALPEVWIRVAQGGQTGPAARKGLDVIAAIRQMLDQNASMLSPDQNIQPRQVIDELEREFKAMGEPGARKVLDDSMLARGETIGELADDLKTRGLIFAEGGPRDGRHYQNLLKAMREYLDGKAAAEKKPVGLAVFR